MTPDDAMRLTDAELINVWSIKPPSALAAECGLSDEQKRELTRRVTVLRAHGWTVRRWTWSEAAEYCEREGLK